MIATARRDVVRIVSLLLSATELLAESLHPDVSSRRRDGEWWRRAG